MRLSGRSSGLFCAVPERNLKDFSVKSIEIYNSQDKYKNKLYDSLVPVINKADYEQVVEDLLRRN